MADQHGVDGPVRLLPAPTDHHALAEGETVSFDRDLSVPLARPPPGRLGLCEDPVLRGRDAGRLHDFLGEGLAALDPARTAVGTEDGKAAVPQGVAHPGCDGSFGAEHDQADLLPARQPGELCRLIRLDRSVSRDARRAAVAGGDIETLAEWGGQALPGQSVLSRAGPDDQDPQPLVRHW